MNIEKLGTMRAAIEGDVKDLTAGIALAKRDIRSFGKDMPGWVKPVGASMLAAGGIVTGALTKMILDAGKYGDALDKMSLRTGIAVEPLSELSYAVKISGSDINALETSVRFLNRRMDEAGQGIGIAVDAFDRLGVEVVDADGSMRDSVTVMMEVADGIVGLTDESERGALAMDIFGARSGPQLLPLLKQGSAGIEELRKKARELGITMSTEAALASAEFEDRLTDIRETAKMASFELGSVFLPTVTDVVEGVTDAVGWFSRLSDTEQSIVGWGTASAGGFAAVSGAGLLVVSMIPRLITGFKSLNIVGIGSGLGLAGASAAAFASSLWAVHRVYEALRDPSYDLVGQLDGLKLANEGTYAAVNTLRDALEGFRSAGVDPLSLSIADLGIDVEELNEQYNKSPGYIQKFTNWITGAGDAIDATISPTANAADVLEKLEENLGIASEKGSNLKDKIDDLKDSEDVAKTVTDEFNKALASINKTVSEGIKEWTELSKGFSAYTAITGEGYGLNTLEAIKYYETVKAKGVETTEAERAVTNTISDLWGKWFSEAEALTNAGVVQAGQAYDRRSTLDEDFLRKIQANADRRLANASESLQKESGIVEGFFHWEVIEAGERTAKLIAERGNQLNEELRLREEHQSSVDHLFERQFLMAQDEEERILELKNIAFQEEQAQFAERESLMKFFLASAGDQFESAIDLQKDFSDKTEEELQTSYQRGVDAIDNIYYNFKESVERYSLDMVELDRWRASQMLQIEQALTAAKIKELEVYSQTYAEHVRETSEFWGVEKGFTIPLGRQRETGFSEQAMYYGLGEAMRMQEEARPVAEVNRMLQQDYQTIGEYASVAGDISGQDVAFLAQQITEEILKELKNGTPVRESVPGGPAIRRRSDLHFHIENLYGAEEGFLNAFAEDVARRLRGLNITV